MNHSSLDCEAKLKALEARLEMAGNVIAKILKEWGVFQGISPNTEQEAQRFLAEVKMPDVDLELKKRFEENYKIALKMPRATRAGIMLHVEDAARFLLAELEQSSNKNYHPNPDDPTDDLKPSLTRAQFRAIFNQFIVLCQEKQNG